MRGQGGQAAAQAHLRGGGGGGRGETARGLVLWQGSRGARRMFHASPLPLPPQVVAQSRNTEAFLALCLLTVAGASYTTSRYEQMLLALCENKVWVMWVRFGFSSLWCSPASSALPPACMGFRDITSVECVWIVL